MGFWLTLDCAGGQSSLDRPYPDYSQNALQVPNLPPAASSYKAATTVICSRRLQVAIFQIVQNLSIVRPCLRQSVTISLSAGRFTITNKDLVEAGCSSIETNATYNIIGNDTKETNREPFTISQEDLDAVGCSRIENDTAQSDMDDNISGETNTNNETLSRDSTWKSLEEADMEEVRLPRENGEVDSDKEYH
ncbi:hypothetical protein CBL_01801 [Carabus blaptoides fortunei]